MTEVEGSNSAGCCAFFFSPLSCQQQRGGDNKEGVLVHAVHVHCRPMHSTFFLLLDAVDAQQLNQFMLFSRNLCLLFCFITKLCTCFEVVK